MIIRLLPALILLTATGCPADDACAPVCPVVGDWYESCLDTWGLTWGAEVGYTDRADWNGWCETIQWEDRLLAQSSEDPDAADTRRLGQCSTQLAAAAAGDCSAYFDLWEAP